jgi:TfoX-like protein
MHRNVQGSYDPFSATARDAQDWPFWYLPAAPAQMTGSLVMAAEWPAWPPGWQCPGRYDHRVTYDEALATRIRDLIGPDPELTEKKMFGGLAFLIRGHMAISASGQGGVLVHVDPGRSAGLVATTRATTAVMQGREMPGWLRLSSEDLASDDDLSRWVDIGIEYARSLPPKQPASRKPGK